MKVISKEEEQAHYNATVRAGAIGGSIGLVAGTAGVMLASRRYPAFRQLTLPFRTFLVTSTATFGSIVTAERASVQYQRAHDPGRTTYRDVSERVADAARAQESTSKRLLETARQHRYQIVLGAWAASMGIALALVGRNKYLTASQKLVQARVYAQGLTVAVLVASAALEVGDAKSGKGRWETVLVLDPADPEHKHLIEKRVHHEEYEGQDLWMGRLLPPFAEEYLALRDRRLTW